MTKYIIAQQKDGVFLLDGQPTQISVADCLCKCCGGGIVDERVLRAIQNTEACLGYKLHINGCARCKKYNKIIGGSTISTHLFDTMKPSIAVDFERKDKPFVNIWQNAVWHFSRVGIYVSKYTAPDGSPQAYFHGDIKERRLFWYRDANRKYHYYERSADCINDFIKKGINIKKEGEQI